MILQKHYGTVWRFPLCELYVGKTTCCVMSSRVLLHSKTNLGPAETSQTASSDDALKKSSSRTSHALARNTHMRSRPRQLRSRSDSKWGAVENQNHLIKNQTLKAVPISDSFPLHLWVSFTLKQESLNKPIKQY